MNSKRQNQMIFGIGMCLGWEIIGCLEVFHPAVFPRLSKVFESLVGLVLSDQLMVKTFYSISVIFFAILLSACVALLLILVSEKCPFVKDNVALLNGVLSPIPGIALLPLIVLWFGLSQKAMMLVLIHATLWPFWSHMALVVSELKNDYARMVKVFKLSRLKQFYYVYFLGAKDALSVALSVAWSRGWRALLSVEMVFGLTGRYSGLGWLIFERRMYMDTAGIFAGLLVVAFLGVLMEQVLFKGIKRGSNEKNH